MVVAADSRTRAGQDTPTLQDVRDAVARLKATGGRVSGGEIARLNGWSKPTVNRRLRELRESSSSLQLVTS
jgi:hypothetical protein